MDNYPDNLPTRKYTAAMAFDQCYDSVEEAAHDAAANGWDVEVDELDGTMFRWEFETEELPASAFTTTRRTRR